MDETFDLDVTYKDKELQIPARLLVQGYTYKIEADIDGCTVWFEPDEEGAFRAVIPTENNNGNPPPDAALLQAVAVALHQALQ